MEVTYDALQKQLAQAREQIVVKDQRIAELEAALRGIIVDCEAQCPHWSIKDDARTALGGKDG